MFQPDLQAEVRQLTLEIFELTKQLPADRARLRRAAAGFASAVGRGAGLQPRAAFKAGAETLSLLRGLQRSGGRARELRGLVERVQELLQRVYAEESA